MGTYLVLKPWSDVHSKSRFNWKTCEAFRTFSTKILQNLLGNIWHYEPTNYNKVMIVGGALQQRRSTGDSLGNFVVHSHFKLPKLW